MNIPDTVGYCLILDYQNFRKRLNSRPGSGYDADRLEQDFNELGFDVDRFLNLTKSETMEILEKAAERDYLGKRYFVCCILSHGNEKEEFHTFDSAVKLDSVLCCFDSKLDEIQKIFILQMCKGKKLERNVNQTPNDKEFAAGSYLGEHYVDYLIVNSTYYGTRSFKTMHPPLGSYFINELCWALENFSSELNLLQILTNVNYHFAYFFKRFLADGRTDYSKNQMPFFISTLRSIINFGRSITPLDSSPVKYFDERKDDSKMTYVCPKSGVLQHCWRPTKENVLFLSVFINKENLNTDFKRVEETVLESFATKNYQLQNFEKSENKKLTRLGIKNFLKSNGNPAGIDCLICLIAGNSMNDRICDESGRKFSKKEVISNFIGVNSKSLIGKPKIFIFLLCEPCESSGCVTTVGDVELPSGYDMCVESTDGVSSRNKFICIDSDNLETSIPSGCDVCVESTDGVSSRKEFIPIHSDILEISITVPGWDRMIGPMEIFSEMLKQSSSVDLLNLLTNFNSELVNRCNFFEKRNESDLKTASFVVTSTLTKFLFLP